MPALRAVQITAFYLFDVCEAIDLAVLRGLIPAEQAPARPAPRPSSPPYVQYHQPPLVVDGRAIGVQPLDGFRVRFKFYEYGVVSLALTQPFAGSWEELLGIGQRLIENEALEGIAERACREALARLDRAMISVRTAFLSEDYLVFGASEIDGDPAADDLLRDHGEEIAQLLRGERQPLSTQEKDEVLRHRISYLSTDLVIPTWNAAFVYDREPGVQDVLEICEFANSQLLEFRYYDDLLDEQLGRIYGDLQSRGWYDALVGGRRYTRAAQQLHSLFIEVTELTDKTENALKMVGDIYAARLFALVAARLSLDRWKASVEDKLETLDDIYRFAVDQTGMSHGNFLELIIVLILIFELVLFFVGIMR